MGLFAVTHVFLGAVCIAIAAMHLAAARRRIEPGTYLWFALAALAAGANALAEPLAFGATRLADYNVAAKWAILFQGLCWITFTWFVFHYASSRRRRLAWAVTAGFAVALVAHVVSPSGVLFSEIASLDRLELPWGESYAVATGPANPWRLPSDLAIALLVIFVFDATLGLARRRIRARAIRIGVLGALLLAALVHGSLVDFGIVRSPYLITFGFFATVVVMGADMVREAVRAADLSREIVEKERRWSALLENVRLLVAGMDGDGRIDFVNPCFCETTGYTREELLGRPFPEVLAVSERERVEAAFRDAIGGQPEGYAEARLVTRDGNERIVVWANVVLKEPRGEPAGVVSIGADVTEQRQAEAARDAAITQLEEMKTRLEEENLYLKQEIDLERSGSGIIGESDAVAYVLMRIRQVASSDTTVLIQGETGVGKELVALAIHDESPRSEGPFVRVNCASLPAGLVESELFGHEAGAFTGATGERRGRFELANDGTLLLDEVAELPPELQSKLLRVLQEGEYERVGGSRTLKSNARVIAATNRDLQTEIAADRFREDLYYRLNVYPITVPPLRDRLEDIPLLVKHFLPEICARTGRDVHEVPGAVLRALLDHAWPGNVRELQNVLERAVLGSTDGILRLPGPLETAASPRDGDGDEEVSGRGGALRSLEEVERRHVRRVLAETGGRIAGPGGAAEILGLHPNTLRSRMKKLGMGEKRGPRESRARSDVSA